MSDATALGVLADAESKGIRLRLVNGKVKAAFSASAQHQMAPVLERLRANRDQVMALLIQRANSVAQSDCHIHGQGVSTWKRPTGGSVCGVCHPFPHESDMRKDDQPQMPPGVRLVSWRPKQSPVVLEKWSVVTDVPLFARRTLEQLKASLDGKEWLAGNWPARDLIERLEQVGVKVVLENAVQVLDSPAGNGMA